MKILHIITLSELGGAQSVVSNLVKAQSIKNDVFIISGGAGDAWNGLNNVNVHLIKELRRSISFRDLIVLYKIHQLKKKINPDVVHLHSSKAGVLGRLVFKKDKLIYTVHGFDSILIANRKFLFIEKILKNRAHKIIAVSKYDEKNLTKVGIKSNVLCIYNGIEDISNKKEISYSPEILNEITEIKKKFKYIACCIARDDYPKKIDLFFEIAQKMPEIAFIWIGNNKTHLYNAENIFLFGIVQSAAIYLKFMDIFILPSNYEGLPISIIEALSFSLPVVASDVGGIAELLNGKNGFTADNTVEDFTYKINNVLSNPSKYKIMRDNARETYERKFTLKRMADNYEKVYKDIISSIK